MERRASRSEQLAALVEVHAVVNGATIERALARRHEPTRSKASEMVRNQTLRSTRQTSQLPDLAIAAGQLDQQPPSHWMSRENEKGWHHTVDQTSRHSPHNTSSQFDTSSEFDALS
jgi:hypothetical protein